MARTKHKPHMIELASRGAEARVRELVDELRLLTAAFPHLRQSFDRDELPIPFILRRGRDRAKSIGRPARKRKWNAAARKAAAARMKAYWAKRKSAKRSK
ncbi:MAG TPA: hypothetical protein VG222_05270 [Vicinamibacterales bacterium]|nr:hypothetical protein [Vicinamibacterales bacterium]